MSARAGESRKNSRRAQIRPDRGAKPNLAVLNRFPIRADKPGKLANS